MGRTKTSRRRGAAAAAGGDGGATGSDDRSQAEEADMELLSSDPEVQEVQLRALDEQRGRPAKVRHSGNVAPPTRRHQELTLLVSCRGVEVDQESNQLVPPISPPCAHQNKLPRQICF
jgi:hypothetical protein